MVGRAVARVAAVVVPLAGMVAGLVVGAAAPAAAADERVRLSAPSSFRAGGSPGAVSLTVARRGPGCIVPRTSLTLRKAGLTAGQVRVEVARAGRWQPVGVRQAAGGAVGVTVIGVEREPLCRGSAATRLRVMFAATVPTGRVTLIGAATARGRVLGRASDEAKVNGGAPATPARTPKPTPKPTPTPTAGESESAAVEPTPVPAVAVATDPPEGGGFGLAGMLVMVGGGGMVLLGVGILIFLLRRPRNEADHTITMPALRE